MVKAVVVCVAAAFVAGCANPGGLRPGDSTSGDGEEIAVYRPVPGDCRGRHRSYMVNGRRYWVEALPVGHVEFGTASWYGERFHGKKTASGEVFDMRQVSAAHRTLPLFSIVRVINLDNGREVAVRINDRGPFVGERLIDLSYAAAKQLDMLEAGTAPVLVVVVRLPDGPRRAVSLVAR